MSRLNLREIKKIIMLYCLDTLTLKYMNFLELMATTLTVDACDSGQSSSSSSCLDSQHNSSCLDSQQEEQSFSYLRNLQALDQDFNGEETYFDEPTGLHLIFFVFYRKVSIAKLFELLTSISMSNTIA